MLLPTSVFTFTALDLVQSPASAALPSQRILEPAVSFRMKDGWTDLPLCQKTLQKTGSVCVWGAGGGGVQASIWARNVVEKEAPPSTSTCFVWLTARVCLPWMFYTSGGEGCRNSDASGWQDVSQCCRWLLIGKLNNQIQVGIDLCVCERGCEQENVQDIIVLFFVVWINSCPIGGNYLRLDCDCWTQEVSSCTIAMAVNKDFVQKPPFDWTSV